MSSTIMKRQIFISLYSRKGIGGKNKETRVKDWKRISDAFFQVINQTYIAVVSAAKKKSASCTESWYENPAKVIIIHLKKTNCCLVTWSVSTLLNIPTRDTCWCL